MIRSINYTLMLKLIDLFAGTGAFSFAFKRVFKDDIQIVYANDINKYSKIIYDLNCNYDKGHELVLKDINVVNIKEEIPEHDILTGGFPCQPFSIAGRKEGFKDDRSNVFWKICEILEYRKPMYVFLENVKNLLTHDKGNTFRIIRENIEKRGYYIKYKVLNTARITGIPQHRERLYIFCTLDKGIYEKFNFEFEEIKKRDMKEFLIDESNEKVSDKYYYDERSKIWGMIEEGVKREDTFYQYRRTYIRENKSKECPTLTANMGTGGHNVPLILINKRIRKLTPRECFNLQGFPNDDGDDNEEYKIPEKVADSHLYKLAGNAVSVPIVTLLAERLKLCLR